MSHFRAAKLAALGMLLPFLAIAHGNGEHVKGTVRSVDGKELAVETPEKKLVTIALDERTQFERSGEPATQEQLEKGERVVVHAKKAPDGTLTAEMVKFGRPATKDSTRGHPTP